MPPPLADFRNHIQLYVILLLQSFLVSGNLSWFLSIHPGCSVKLPIATQFNFNCANSTQAACLAAFIPPLGSGVQGALKYDAPRSNFCVILLWHSRPIKSCNTTRPVVFLPPSSSPLVSLLFNTRQHPRSTVNHQKTWSAFRHKDLELNLAHCPSPRTHYQYLAFMLCSDRNTPDLGLGLTHWQRFALCYLGFQS
jgi:hypothetical protein